VKPLVNILIATVLISAVAVSCGKNGDTKKTADEPTTAAEYLKRAKGNFLDKNKAIRDLNEAIELDDGLIEAYEMRAEMYEGRYTATERTKYARRAIADYGKLIELEPEAARAAVRLRKRGWLKMQLEEYDEAIADFRASVDKDARKPKTYEYLAEAYRGNDDLDNAVKAYGYAIKYDRKEASLYKSRARAYFDLGQTEKALADLGKVIEIQPDYEAYAARAQIYRELGRPQEALDDYEKARSLNPEAGEGGTIW